MNVYVVVNKPCCNYPMKVVGVYTDPDEAWQAAEDCNSDAALTHADATIHESILIGRYDG